MLLLVHYNHMQLLTCTVGLGVYVWREREVCDSVIASAVE